MCFKESKIFIVRGKNSEGKKEFSKLFFETSNKVIMYVTLIPKLAWIFGGEFYNVFIGLIALDSTDKTSLNINSSLNKQTKKMAWADIVQMDTTAY